MTTTNIQGMDELKKVLKNLPYQVSTRLVVTALRKAAKPMKDEAVNLAPKRKGTTKKAITIVKNQFEDKPSIMIAPTKGRRATYDAWYSRFQEHGTGGFGKRIRALSSVSVDLKHGAVRRRFKTTGYALKGNGLPAIRFMANAFQNKKEQTLGSVSTQLSNVVVSYLKRNAPKYYAR